MFGDALSFDGSNDLVEILHSDSLNLYDGNFTFSFWINFSSIAAITIITKPAYYGTYEIQYRTDSHNFEFLARNSTLDYVNVGSSVFVPIVNEWYFIVFTYDGVNGKFYISGLLDNSVAVKLNPRINDPSYDVFIGGRNDVSNLFNGTLDDFRVYNRSLSAVEVVELYLLNPLVSASLPTSTPLTIIIDNTLNWEMVFLLVLLISNLALCGLSKVPLLNFAVGGLSFAVAALTIGDSSLPFQPYFSLILLFTSVLTMLMGAMNYQGDSV
jgi:hypothetical protein